MYDYSQINLIDFTGEGNFDNSMTMIDSDMDGIVETVVLYEDTTGNGQIDTTTYLTDSNLNGVIDSIMYAMDTDGNMIPDTFISMFDTTGDGEFDMVVKSHDYNQDGIIDSSTTYRDVNGDGNPDIVTKQYSSNDGGSIHTVENYHDFTGDGNPNYIEKHEYWDTNDDGIADKITVEVDHNGSGYFDEKKAFAFNPHTKQIIPMDLSFAGSIGGTYAEDLQNFDPANSNPDRVIGDPVQSMACWEFQGNTNRCALFSQMFIIEELTGQQIGIDELATVAEKNGWFTEDGGTTFLNMNNVLDAYGIENEMSFHSTIDDIKECLKNGGKVVVSIDADQIWYGKDSNIFSPAQGANHAVQVIAIDYTNSDEPMAVLNDSGSPNGRGEMVPLSIFDEAWEAGNRQMITCYA